MADDAIDADAAAFAALVLAEALYVGIVRSGGIKRNVAVEAIESLAAMMASRSPAHAAAARELRRFKTELAEKTITN